LNELYGGGDINAYMPDLHTTRRTLKEFGVVIEEEDIACQMLTRLPSLLTSFKQIMLTKDQALQLTD